MSDLQCAARLLIARTGESEDESAAFDESVRSLTMTGRKQAAELGDSRRDARISMVYSSSRVHAVQTAEIVGGRRGVVVRFRDALQGTTRFADELGAVVDLHRGETVLVVTHDEVIRAAVPQLAGNVPDDYGDAHEVAPCGVIELDADADGWLLRSWSGEPVR